MDARRDRRDRRIHVAVVGLLLVVEHHRHDQDDDVGLARGGGAVGRRPQAARRRGRRATSSASPGSSATCERPSLIASTTRLLDVDRDHVPAVRRRTGPPAAGPSCRRRRRRPCPAVPGSPVHGATWRAGSWRQALAGSSIEPPSRLGADVGRETIVMRSDLDGQAARSTVRRSRAARQERVGDGDRPQAVLGVDDRPAAVADDAEERVELGGERLAPSRPAARRPRPRTSARSRRSGAGSSCRSRG